MTDVAIVSAGDIARLGGVGRAAVSNWRRRHADFPTPVAGTPASPRYDLADVETWLRANGKTAEIPPLERVWHQLCAEAGEIGLGHVVARAGALLVWLRDGDRDELVPGVAERADPGFVELVESVAALHGHAAAFESLHGLYQESHARRLGATPPDVAATMLDLAGAGLGTLLDPACGTGSLLLASTADRLLGRDVAPDRALIAAARLRLQGRDADVVDDDSMRHSTFDAEIADAVVCDPPFGDPAWSRTALRADPRWEYGVPPRGEPELAWVQHCVASVRTGGRVVVRMPVAAAKRRSGQPIRTELLRRGTLRAVVAAGPDTDVWVLRRPAPGEPAPTQIVLCGRENTADLGVATESGHGVLIDDLTDADVSPPRTRAATGRTPGYPDHARTIHATTLNPPALRTRHEPSSPPTTPLSALERAGAVTVLRSTARDPIALRAGDVVAAGVGTHVVTAGSTLPSRRTAYRCDPDRVDPEYLAGLLRTVGPSRAEQRRARLPVLGIEEQRHRGRSLRALADLRDEMQSLAASTETLVRSATAGLLAGHLDPA